MKETVQHMIEAAEKAAAIAETIRNQAQKAHNDALAVAKGMKENGVIPINNCGWFVSSNEVFRLAEQDDEFNRVWGKLRDEAIQEAREKRNADLCAQGEEQKPG